MYDIIFIHPNTEDGINSKTVFSQEIKDFCILRSVQCIPCLENKRSIASNIDVIKLLKPKLIILSNEFDLDIISNYTDILFSLVKNEKEELYKSFFILTYQNRHYQQTDSTKRIFEKEVDIYYDNIEEMMSDVEQQILNVKAFKKR